MRLSIITINRNNAVGLEKTLQSINAQTCKEFEHIIIDGASTDGSVDTIQWFCDPTIQRRWISEPDKGIYNAMNKGIRMATGEYLQFLNSGDCLASNTVVEQMWAQLQILNSRRTRPVDILYGNMIEVHTDGTVIGKSTYTEYSLLQFYTSTLNHDCAYIHRELFDKEQYGLYDETLKIVSDWKWFLQTIGLGTVKPDYVDIDVTLFNAGGVSEVRMDLRNEERRRILEQLLPPAVFVDYEKWAFSINQMKRLQRHPWAYKCVWFLERCLFKLEKLKINKYEKGQSVFC